MAVDQNLLDLLRPHVRKIYEAGTGHATEVANRVLGPTVAARLEQMIQQELGASLPPPQSQQPAPQQPAAPSLAGQGGEPPPAPAPGMAELVYGMLQSAAQGDMRTVHDLADFGSDPHALADFLSDQGPSPHLPPPTGFAWHWVPNRSGHGRHVENEQGYKIYGKRANAIMDRQGKIDSGEISPIHPTRARAMELKAQREVHRVEARKVLQKALSDPGSVHPDELHALAIQIHTLTRNEIRDNLRELQHKVGGLKIELVDRLINHVRQHREAIENERSKEKPPIIDVPDPGGKQEADEMPGFGKDGGLFPKKDYEPNVPEHIKDLDGMMARIRALAPGLRLPPIDPARAKVTDYLNAFREFEGKYVTRLLAPFGQHVASMANCVEDLWETFAASRESLEKDVANEDVEGVQTSLSDLDSEFTDRRGRARQAMAVAAGVAHALGILGHEEVGDAYRAIMAKVPRLAQQELHAEFDDYKVLGHHEMTRAQFDEKRSDPDRNEKMRGRPATNPKTGDLFFTQAEAKKYLEDHNNENVEFMAQKARDPYGKPTGRYTLTAVYSHKFFVRQALEDGKPVPPEVLAEYPDLAKEYGKGGESDDTITSGEQPGDEHGNDQLEGERPTGTGGGVSSGEPLGTDAPQGDERQPEGGTSANGGSGSVSSDTDPSGDGGVRPPVGGGNATADGPGTGSGGSAGVSGPGLPKDENGTRLGGGLDGEAPALPDPTPDERSFSEEPSEDNPTDVSAGNYRYDDREVFERGLKAKFQANLAAIRCLRQIEEEGRTTATPEEQAILAKFTGWGQFPGVFNDWWDSDFQQSLQESGQQEDYNSWKEKQNKWAEERKAIKGLLTSEEWDAARHSTLNAHYTHPSIVDAHWKMAEKLGFKGGRFLETSAGIGYYLGMMPGHIAAKARATAVEKDPTTAKMLRLLYPASNALNQGFESPTGTPDNYYDLVASNVPFGNYKVHDPKYARFKANIHDYFFLKSRDVAKPGGLIMHITSTGTLDKPDDEIRRELYKDCDLVSAIRFPGSAHKENAGTEVVTDMLILRKRLPGEKPGDDSWLQTTTVPDPDGKEPIPVNAYFAKNPDQILGRLDRTGTMYKADSKNVSRTEDYEERLQAAIDRLPSNILATNRAPRARFEPERLPAPGDVRDGGFHVDDKGRLFVRNGASMTEVLASKEHVDRIRGHMEVRDAVRALIHAERSGKDSTKLRKALNDAYDTFVAKHGPTNDKKNRQAFGADPDSPLMLALEKYDPKTKKATKADIFSKATVRPDKTITKVNSIEEGLGATLHEHGYLNIEHLAKITGKSVERVGKYLAAAGLAFEDPSEGWQHADQYLSGNVRRKLANAVAAAAGDPRFAANVKALQAVQPEDIHHDDIHVPIGAHWVPKSDYHEFAKFLMDSNYRNPVEVIYHPATGQWQVAWSKESKFVRNGRLANTVYGTDDADFAQVMQAAMTDNPIVVRRPLPGGEKGETYVDVEATKAVAEKAQAVKDKFNEWVWTDKDRRDRLHRYYNDNFNNIRPISYNGSHLQFPGLNPAIELRDHQKDFVWQTITTGKGLAGHEVGTGKTLSMIAAAMELRRLGLAKKPALVCKKANVDAITQDALHAYPGARIISTADMFNAKKRKETAARIATGDYDMVILTHDHLDMLPSLPQTQAKYLKAELEELESAREAAFQAAGGKRSDKVVKKLDNQITNLTVKIQNALAEEKKDDAVYFEDLGIDHLFVDEAHRYKTLPVYTKMGGLKGVPTGRSQRATGMKMKCGYIMDHNKGRGVTFLTGTPISNTIPELYTMQRYIQPEELKERGIDKFDAWAKCFGQTVSRVEPTVTGEYKTVNRFAKFANLPELMAISRQMLDVQRATDMKNVAKFGTQQEAMAHARKWLGWEGEADPAEHELFGNGIEIKQDANGNWTTSTPVIRRPIRRDKVNVAPETPAMAAFMKKLQARAEKLKAQGKPEKGMDNMLKICTDGRKAAIDIRLVDPHAEDDPNSKLNQLVRNVLEISKANPGKTQMIFSDLSRTNAFRTSDAPDEVDDYEPDEDETETAGSSGGGGQVDMFNDIIGKLVKGGIPREAIADFRNLKDKARKDAVEGLRTGKVLIGIGGTETLGTGVNAQDKLLAMHHLDCPWRPADLEQRDGRGWRHGNENKNVHIHRYVTEKSLDATMWDAISRKSAFIRQIMKPTGKLDRMVDEIDTEELSPEQIMAAATGDPRILEKVQLEDEVKALTNSKKRHENEQSSLKHAVENGDSVAKGHEKSVKGWEEALAHLDANPEFHMQIGGQSYTDRAEAKAAWEEAFDKAPDSTYRPAAIYRGLKVFKNRGGVDIEAPNGWKVPIFDPTFGRIENVGRRFRTELDMAKDRQSTHHREIANLKSRLGQEFPKAKDLETKSARLKQITQELLDEGKKKQAEALMDNEPPGGWKPEDKVPGKGTDKKPDE